MGNRNSLFMGSLVAVLSLGLCVDGLVTPTPEIILCGGLLPEGVKQANISTTLTYDVETNPAGRVVRVSPSRQTVLPDERIIACLKRWVLPYASTKVRVSWGWEHAKGWTSLTIAMPDDERSLTITPGWAW
jgi:hypothetical protein